MYPVGELDHAATHYTAFAGLYCQIYASGDEGWWIPRQESPGGEEIDSEAADWSGNVACNLSNVLSV